MDDRHINKLKRKGFLTQKDVEEILRWLGYLKREKRAICLKIDRAAKILEEVPTEV